MNKSKAEYYRDQILQKQKKSAANIATDLGIAEEDVFDIVFFRKICFPSYLEQQVETCFRKQRSLQHLSRTLSCSLRTLRQISLRLRKGIYDRVVRTMPSLDESAILAEIRKDRKTGIGAEFTTKRLFLPLEKYYQLVHQHDIPLKGGRIFYSPDLVTEIHSARLAGKLLEEIISSLNIPRELYHLIVTREQLPHKITNIYQIKDLSSVVETILSDREKGVLTKDTVANLGISPNLYQRLVTKHQMPKIKDARADTSYLVEEIEKNRQQGLSTRKSAEKLGISTGVYNKIVSRQGITRLKDNGNESITYPYRAQEIHNDREKGILPKVTAERLQISLDVYKRIVSSEKLPSLNEMKRQKLENRRDTLVIEILRDRDNRVPVVQTVKRLGINKHIYDRILKEQR